MEQLSVCLLCLEAQDRADPRLTLPAHGAIDSHPPYTNPHFPFIAPQELADLYADFEPDCDDTTVDLPDCYRSLAHHFGLSDWSPTREDKVRAIRL